MGSDSIDSIKMFQLILAADLSAAEEECYLLQIKGSNKH